MASHPEKSLPEEGEDLEVLRRMDAIGDVFAEGLEEDSRLQSGVPEEARDSDLEFIEMSGFRATEPVTPPDTDTSKPLSFYEQGIDDVDDELAPYSEFGEPYTDEEMAADVLAPAPVAGLKDIIADLTRKPHKPAPRQEPPDEPAAEEPLEAIGDRELDLSTEPGAAEPEEEQAFEMPAGAEELEEKLERLLEPLPEDAGESHYRNVLPAEMPQSLSLSEPDDRPEEAAEAATEAPSEPEPVEPAPRAEEPAPRDEIEDAFAGFYAAPAEPADEEQLHEEAEGETYGNEEGSDESGVDLQDLLSQVRNEILDGIKGDIASLEDSRQGKSLSARAGEPAEKERPAESAPMVPEPPEYVPVLDAEPEADLDTPEPILLDEPAGDVEPAPDVPQRETSPPKRVPELAEAERLIAELQLQPSPVARPEIEPIDLATIGNVDSGVVEGGEGEDAEDDSTVYHQPPSPHTRKGSRQKRRARRMVKAVLVLAILVAAIFSAFLVFQEFAPGLSSPDTIFQEAQRLEEQEQYRRASDAYHDFAARFPNDPRAPLALYQAAFVLQAIPPGVGGDHYEASLALLQRFENEHPNSELIPRVEILKGIVHYRLHNYDEAIAILQNNQLRRLDYGAALPALRVLAQAHAAAGDYEAARNELQKAATLPGNFSADQDYAEMGGLYAAEANEAVSRAEKARLYTQAVRYMQLAMRVPGIERARRNELERQLNALAEIADEHLPAGAIGVNVATPGMPPLGPALPLPEIGVDSAVEPVLPPEAPLQEEDSSAAFYPFEEGGAERPAPDAAVDTETASPAEAPAAAGEPEESIGEGQMPEAVSDTTGESTQEFQ